MSVKNLTINDRIRAVRKELKITQTELAEQIGVSKSFISDIENSRRPVSKKTIQKLNKELGVSVEYLKYGSGQIVKNNVPENVLQNVPFLDSNNDNNSLEEFEKIFGDYEPYGKVAPVIARKILASFHSKHPDFEKIKTGIYELLAFKTVIERLEYEVFDPVNVSDRYMETLAQYGIENFKQKLDEEYKVILPLQKPLENLSYAIKQFYKEMKEAGSDIDFEIFQ